MLVQRRCEELEGPEENMSRHAVIDLDHYAAGLSAPLRGSILFFILLKYNYISVGLCFALIFKEPSINLFKQRT